jgi:hypothetical protein
MTGSEFQELWRYLAVLEGRVKTLENLMAALPLILKLTTEQEDTLIQIALGQERMTP